MDEFALRKKHRSRDRSRRLAAGAVRTAAQPQRNDLVRAVHLDASLTINNGRVVDRAPVFLGPPRNLWKKNRIALIGDAENVIVADRASRPRDRVRETSRFLETTGNSGLFAWERRVVASGGPVERARAELEQQRDAETVRRWEAYMARYGPTGRMHDRAFCTTFLAKRAASAKPHRRRRKKRSAPEEPMADIHDMRVDIVEYEAMERAEMDARERHARRSRRAGAANAPEDEPMPPSAIMHVIERPFDMRQAARRPSHFTPYNGSRFRGYHEPVVRHELRLDCRNAKKAITT